MQAGCVQASIESRISCACVSVQLVQAFTHAPAALEADRGGKFHMVDGNVTGEFTDLVPEKHIAMKWRFKSWPEGK